MVPNLGPSSDHCVVKPEVLHHPEQFSLIYSQHPFIVPSGSFLEFYYWDSYWVIEGLLLSEMPERMKGMLQNFLDLMQIYGHVPNGACVYYLQRSQPPLLTLMMDYYVTYTNDTAFLQDIGTLALELDFWIKNRNISVSLGGKSYILNLYYVPYGGPRPIINGIINVCKSPGETFKIELDSRRPHCGD